ncbi:Membrane associated serine protease, rhomboid family [Marinobacter daqiaonensis]|uniref:Membrane associated serine protease, rhomboid family n=1 Tax=Marinobacter daqiaonensis TaxID=650891 RepID=A0A1I6JPC1_9GAMM|nr:rhomboid family intramembrane serine protease [Marinobacter daqiaonensis]SFR80832.1 Membrane associated serine protease, rhomboid family [Marinobacter daqiaonensis]
MLIIPAEKSLDWKNPPWMTLALMLACLVIFVFYQGKDPRLLHTAVQHYLDQGLDRLEAPIYETYLEREIRLEGEADRRTDLEAFRETVAAGERASLAVTMLMDRPFFDYLLANRDLLMNGRQRQYWTEARVPIQQNLINEISAYEAGLVPAEPSLYTLVSYQFLHGGWGHLIGNLVFLFLLGFTVEKALGPGRYLLAYLMCGVFSALIYTGFSWGSKIPLVGASGSISGLMGMYVAFFGMRRIRFFYFLGVYFNYFRAPALAILPVWIGKELYDYWAAGSTGIAYMAHAGGLVAGAGLILLLGKGWFQAREAFHEPEQEEQDRQFTHDYADAMEALARMDFTLARKRFEALWRDYPDRPVVLEHLYQLAKLRPDLAEYRQRTRELLNQYLKLQQPDNLLRTWQEYLELGEAIHPLEAEEHNRVLFAALRQDDLKVAEKAFARVRDTGHRELVREAGRLLADEFGKRRMEPKANEYRLLLKTL